MKIGIITKANPKGQVVIPKEYREALGMKTDTPLHLTVRGKGLYVQPIREVIIGEESESTYPAVLERTKGKWGKEAEGKGRRQRALELKASHRRKHEW